MSQTLSSGIKTFDGTDNVNRQAFNDNWTVIDAKLSDYYEVVDTSTKDATAGVYTTVSYNRTNGNTYLKAVLSGKDANGNYLTDTWTVYAADGVTVTQTVTWTLTYDSDGLITNKTYTVS